MLRIARERLRQGYRTTSYPKGPAPDLPERFQGLPVIDQSKCRQGCEAAVAACPTGALSMGRDKTLSLDLGTCIFCGACAPAAPPGAITFTRDYRLAVRGRRDLVVRDAGLRLAEGLGGSLQRLLGRSLRLRQVSAGGCNACEADANVLSTVGWDMGRFGIQFVASPRHADGLLITGPVTRNMRLALQKTYDAVPDPKIVIASGACAISGGPYIGSPEASDGAAGAVKVDLFVPGCPPHPLTLLDGLLRLLGRIRQAPGG
jgi:Ni,Fe-hydrogenase III small subunit/NAD-dependent dihydropyrimidine dehydrogenase PreA subunit